MMAAQGDRRTGLPAPAAEARVAPAPAELASMAAALADRRAQASVLVVKARVCREPMAPAGSPKIETIAAFERLRRTVEAAQVRNFPHQEWSQEGCRVSYLWLLHNWCRNVGSRKAMRHNEYRRGWASVTSYLAFH